MDHGFTPPVGRALRSLSLAYFVQATGAFAVVGALAAIAAGWGLSEAQGAYLITAFGVTFALAAPLLQVAVGHLKRRRQVLIGLAVFSLAALGFAVAQGYGGLFAARVAMGLGAALIGPVLAALGSSLVDREQQGPAIAVVLLGLSVAGMLGLPLSAWVANEWGARTLFAGIGLAGVLTAALIWRWVPDHAVGERVRLGELAALLTHPASLSAFLVVFFIASGLFSTYAFLAPIIREVYGAGPDTVTAALLVLGVAGVLGNLYVVRAARRYSAEGLLVSGIALLVAVMLYLLCAPPSLAGLFVALVVWAFATDLLWPTQQRRIVELMAPKRGIALALTASFLFCGIGFGSAVAGWIYPRYGYAGTLACSIALLAMALASLRISVQRYRLLAA